MSTSSEKYAEMVDRFNKNVDSTETVPLMITEIIERHKANSRQGEHLEKFSLVNHFDRPFDPDEDHMWGSFRSTHPS